MLPTTVELLRDILRDRLIHDYGGVDYAIVWDVAASKAGDLAAKLRPILEAGGQS